MNVAVFGLGYVGCVTAACLARNGHTVIGVDVQPVKVDALLQGKSPILEPGLDRLIQESIEAKRLYATTNAAEAVEAADLALICVGTPSSDNGNVDLRYVLRVCQEIGAALKNKEQYMVIVVRSTMLPGKATSVLIPMLEQSSGKKAGLDFGFCINPEFLREGSAIADFDNPPYTIIGELDERSGAKVAELYANLDAPIHRVALGAAEMVKYASNAFHALKVVFANEIGNLCQSYGIDSHEVMNIFVQDTKLNLSPRYLKPGFAFGGSCLGKDMRAILYAARQANLRLPVLESILPSNNLQVQKALQMLIKEDKRKVGIIGLSFKANTDDLRESPAVELVERLIGKGFDVQIYDREVLLSRLLGSNRAFIDHAIPHISSLLCQSLEETIMTADAVVVTKALSDTEYETLTTTLRPDQTVIDLVRLNGDSLPNFKGAYRGICW